MTEQGKTFTIGIIKTAVKIFIAAAVIFWFFRKHGSAVLSDVDNFKFWYLIPPAVLTLFSTMIASRRWQVLAEMSGIKLSSHEAFSLTMQGMFFSLVIPGGAIGGDVVKMAALSGHIRPGTRTEGFFSVFMDRVVGMFALFMIVPVLLCVCYPLFAGISSVVAGVAWLNGNVLWWLIMGICVAGLVAGVALFLHRQMEKIPGFAETLHFFDRKSNGKITRIMAASDNYAAMKESLIFWIILTVIFVHLLPALAMYFFLTGAGAQGAVIPIAAAVTVGNIAGLIPVFPSGIGGRDVVTVALLVAAGYPVQCAMTAQLFSTLLMIVFNLSGAIFFICDRKQSGNIK